MTNNQKRCRRGLQRRSVRPPFWGCSLASLFSISLPTRRLLAASQWVNDGEKGLYYNVRNITTHLKEAWSGLGSFRIRPFWSRVVFGLAPWVIFLSSPACCCFSPNAEDLLSVFLTWGSYTIWSAPPQEPLLDPEKVGILGSLGATKEMLMLLVSTPQSSSWTYSSQASASILAFHNCRFSCNGCQHLKPPLLLQSLCLASLNLNYSLFNWTDNQVVCVLMLSLWLQMSQFMSPSSRWLDGRNSKTGKGMFTVLSHANIHIYTYSQNDLGR